MPLSVAKVMELLKDMGITKFNLSMHYLEETETQFPGLSDTLTAAQLRRLGDLGITTSRPKLAWLATGAGLKRGGPDEAYFLLLRSRATPSWYSNRAVALAAAASVSPSCVNPSSS